MPLPLTAFTLRQWMSESNISLTAIGLTALIGLAYSLKILGRRCSTMSRRRPFAAWASGGDGWR